MQLTLPENQVVWGMPERDILLSAENPGPVEIPWADFTSLEKHRVVASIRAGVVLSDEDPSAILQREFGIVPPEPSTNIPVPLVVEQGVLKDPELALGAHKIREIIRESTDVDRLQVMLNEEVRDKQRKSVLLWLHQRIARLSQSSKDTASFQGLGSIGPIQDKPEYVIKV